MLDIQLSVPFQLFQQKSAELCSTASFTAICMCKMCNWIISYTEYKVVLVCDMLDLLGNVVVRFFS